MSNLDVKIQEIGYELARNLEETEINKLLGVLANDGVYAMWIYSLEKVKSNQNEWLKNICKALKALGFTSQECDNPDKDNLTKDFQNLSKNLSNLLYFKEVMEKVLIYARYHKKAM